VTRPKYSVEGFARRFRMSRAQLHVFVEGRDTDPYFYDCLCRRLFASEFDWEILTPDAVPGVFAGVGGKKFLLGYFDSLKRTKLLSGINVNGEKYAVVFCLDKDVDDLLGKRRRSPYVIYTRYYEVENELFDLPSLRSSVAAVLSVPEGCVPISLADSAVWRADVQRRWLPWTVLCLLSVRNQIPGGGYARQNSVNVPADASAAKSAVDARLREIATASGRTFKEVEAEFTRTLKRAEGRVDKGEGDLMFKGKWYLTVLAAEVEHALPRHYSTWHGFRDGIRAALRLAISYEAPERAYYLDGMRRALAA